jgi:predicted ArsR family transcriptional regulator
MSSFLPINQAAKVLGTTPAALRKKLQRGRISGKKDISGKWLVDVGQGDTQSVHLSYHKMDFQEEQVSTYSVREIEILTAENNRLNERYDQLLRINAQLVDQQENEQVLRRDMQKQLAAVTEQLANLRTETVPLLEDRSRLGAEHKTLKVAVVDLLNHLTNRNKQ